MVYEYDGFNWLIRLNSGESLVDKLKLFAKKESVKGAYIFGLGTASKLQLGFYDQNKQKYNWTKYKQPLEIVSLTGNITWENDMPIIHLHGSFAGDSLEVFGGHVKELSVGSTCEIFVHGWFKQGKVKRLLDKHTGLKLLDL